MTDYIELICRIKSMERVRLQMKKKISKKKAEIKKKNLQMTALKSGVSRLEIEIEKLKNDAQFASSVEYIVITDKHFNKETVLPPIESFFKPMYFIADVPKN